MKFKIFLTGYLVVLSSSAYAGADVARRAQAIEQQRAIQQQQMVAQYQQAALQAQKEAYQQALYQRQRQVQQQQIQYQKQVYQHALEQKAVEQMAYQKAAEQAMFQRLQGQAYQQALQQRALEQNAYQAALMQEQVLQSQASEQASLANYQERQKQKDQELYARYQSTPEPPYAGPQEVVSMSVLWDELEVTSEVWPQIIDQQPKELTVSRYVESFRKQGVEIRKTPGHYVEIIDSMSKQDPEMLEQPFADILKVVAIIEYDFNNGIDKDQMALRVLGQQGYEANKKRLGL